MSKGTEPTSKTDKNNSARATPHHKDVNHNSKPCAVHLRLTVKRSRQRFGERVLHVLLNGRRTRQDQHFLHQPQPETQGNHNRTIAHRLHFTRTSTLPRQGTQHAATRRDITHNWTTWKPNSRRRVWQTQQNKNVLFCYTSRTVSWMCPWRLQWVGSQKCLCCSISTSGCRGSWWRKRPREVREMEVRRLEELTVTGTR